MFDKGELLENCNDTELILPLLLNIPKQIVTLERIFKSYKTIDLKTNYIIKKCKKVTTENQNQ